MKKLFILTVLFSCIVFSQEILKNDEKNQITLEPQKISKRVLDLDNQLLLAKKNGNIEEINKIEAILKQEYLKDGIKVEYDSSRYWVVDTTNEIKAIELCEDENMENISLKGSNDIFIASSSVNEKCVSIARDSNGDLYAVFELYNTDYNTYSIRIKKSINNGQSWSYWHGWYSEQNDLLYPSIAIKRGYEDRLMLTYYYSDKSSIRLVSYNIDDASDRVKWLLVAPESDGSENIRPRIITDNDYSWYSYIVWIEEDGGLRGANDLYYSRLKNPVSGTPSTPPVRVTSGVYINADIGKGLVNPIIVYQADGWPGQIKLLISNSVVGDPDAGWTETTLLRAS